MSARNDIVVEKTTATKNPSGTDAVDISDVTPVDYDNLFPTGVNLFDPPFESVPTASLPEKR